MDKNYTPADIVIYNIKKKSRVCESSLIAFDKQSFKVLAVGNEAAKMNCTKEQACVSPFHLGEVVDFTVATALMKQLMKREFAGSILKPVLAVCLPELSNPVASKAYEELFLVSGARKVDMFYDVTLDEFIEKCSETELKKYTGVIWITKENINDYAGELMAETYERLIGWGLSKEKIIDIIQGI